MDIVAEYEEPRTPNPPDGYRLLESGERVKDGDLYYNYAALGWVPAVAIGFMADDIAYARKIEPEYRILNAGELIQDGDEYSKDGKEWRAACVLGYNVVVYRRRIN